MEQRDTNDSDAPKVPVCCVHVYVCVWHDILQCARCRYKATIPISSESGNTEVRIILSNCEKDRSGKQ